MQLSMKCSVAVHCLLYIYGAEGKKKVTSQLLAESTGCNPVIIRNTLSALKKTGIISVALGTGGAHLTRDIREITLLDIYKAMEPNGIPAIIGIHDCKDRACPVAQNIADILKEPYQKIEESIKTTMSGITLQNLADSLREKIEKSPLQKYPHDK